MKRRTFLATAAATTVDAMHGHAAAGRETTYDYIVVGAGAGGGPLACRLALAGKKVLLLDAGGDPAKSQSRDYPDAKPGEVHDTPCYYAAASEDKEMSWQFSVRHYADTKRQEEDDKYNPKHDDPVGTGGVFYPRSAGLGGCTAHHAMILIRPQDRDWEHIAQLTGDASWQAAKMQPYFAKFERCQYVPFVRRVLGTLTAPLTYVGRKVKQLVHPEGMDCRSGHGFFGWQPTSFTALSLAIRISQSDKHLGSILEGARQFITGDRSRFWGTVRQLSRIVRSRFAQRLDPNDLRTRRKNPSGPFFIPTGMDSGHDALPFKAKRAGVREFILKTQRKHPDKLHVVQGMHVLRVLFAASGQGGSGAPRAVGVECMQGSYLYKASPLQPTSRGSGPLACYRTQAQGEVILCGGAFNTPQLLMLSGIGDSKALSNVPGLHGIKGVDGRPLSRSGIQGPRFVDLPGVGRNLQDRYEIAVISTLKDGETFTTLSENKVSFVPGDPKDKARCAYQKGRDSLYATNGGTMAYMQTSGTAADSAPEPDLFVFGVPAAFRGFYWGWSKELLRRTKLPNGETESPGAKPHYNLWSWVILKAYTDNNAGTVRLRSASPFDTPRILFRSFDEGGTPGWRHDLKALLRAVKQARQINAHARTDEDGEVFATEVQPGADKHDSEDVNSPLAKWIKNEAWGHHACGTCRIGSDPWRPDTRLLQDKMAVLDSKFRVHGVEGLRVVDASVFPKIPGYFIAAPIFMVSEKAADVILSGE
ncbi:choline dehydrogenase [Roseimicrobium gellanilyticum]|uniref:Choline dehydrogenase n=1 Tax=Roseimicrobium gellanilyticum TaxID=748857 RepID=A0A366H5C6_9BACT|nr:GMC oxidoreductase [Roseimicrobium gellanilyticum]RBP36574.1 choline dehydrogenase [Roseimicrobium gellanilyticum]